MYLQRTRNEAVFGVFNIAWRCRRAWRRRRSSTVIPFLVSPWNMLSLEEAAIIDGASPLQTLTRIVLPLSTASIATIGLFYAVWHWNEWFYAFLYINDTVKLPLQVVLRNILTAGMIEDTEMIPIDQLPPAQSLKTAMIVVPVTPHPVRLPLHPALLREGRHDRRHQGIVTIRCR